MSELIIVLAIWNIAVMILYGVDKMKAARGSWRISENTLLICAFLAGGAGAFLGMSIFRHKTKNKKFKILVPVAFLLNIAAAGFFVYGNISGEGAGYIRISASEAYAMMQSGDVLILDVRSANEFAGGHIEGAILLPGTEIRNRIEEFTANKAQTILVYCRSGVRSAEAARTLIKMGYTSVYDFGGIMHWPYEIVR